jgi:hypothetical protein
MCFSADVSFGAAALLTGTGAYALRLARQLQAPYRAWAIIPILFGVQQAFEGLVWQALAAQKTSAVIIYALGFHFFSYFLWLWWLPLSSYLVEPNTLRKKLFAGCTLLGAFAGALVYATMLMHSEWLSVSVREHSILYDFSVPYRSDIHIPITPMMLYGLLILLPLLASSHRRIKLFGVLVVISMALAAALYNKAFVSVWCFFAAVLSLYLVYMIHHLVTAEKSRSA